ncbi:tetraacyldisaccharide 4'-kinase [Synoicihabitans lomoniglobus]|uniref:Tetraacyldisaccharide 4'-kinase n=1 Tax=Synoicihabitans lomoniglobus TaxID=2909285 RepID=A0AAF0CS62_9BACT|nr:tetraacyldisaccharide 4'-kinase [Opitutaceae bacterium LMO-M01]WED67042.1 tetraacyldisaccharide 4'-kinase [Opitutaceae bacterium LMO-M01]
MSSPWLKQKLISFEQFAIDVVYGRRDDLPAVIFAGGLQGLSYLFKGIVKLRWWLYRHRVLHDQPLGCLVVVVGNLTVGGTGKTPVVEKFARALRDQGRRVAILSRGYKSKAPPMWKKWWFWITHTAEPPPRIVSDGNEVLLNSEEAGDEPYMLARNLPGVLVLVDKNRVKAGTYAIKRFGCDTLILDDGFQYMPLKGRLNLLLVDKTNPFGNGFLLPRGILREPISHLKRASYVFLTKSNGQRDTELEDLIQKHNPGVDIIECTHQPQYLQLLGEAPENEATRRPLEELQLKRIGAFSGIATPESFEKFLRDLGADIAFARRFLDHYRFVPSDFVEIFSAGLEHKVDMIVTTEKDAVRIASDMPCPVPIYYLRLEIDILHGADDFDEAVGRLCFEQTR